MSVKAMTNNVNNYPVNNKPPSRYHKEVQPGVYIDVYDVLELYNVKSHAVGHAIKKLLMPGRRGSKDEHQDLKEAVASINRAIQSLERNGA